MRVWALRSGLAALTVAMSAGCGSSSPPLTPPWHMLTASVSVAGYVVQPELKAVSTLQSAGPRSLFDGAAVYSFRRSGTLLAVLEIGEFLPSSDVVSPDFQAEVVGQVGESVPQRTHELGRIVYEGTANSQSIFMWFDGRRLMVLLVHDIDNPRGFLQSVLRSLA